MPSLPIVTAPSFMLGITALGKQVDFNELSGITSKVGVQEYIYSNKDGEVVHTKQFGKTEPPTVTLKRGLDTDGNAAIMAWHEMSRQGTESAQCDCELTILDASGNMKIGYMLWNAWCSDVTIGNVKAGESAAVTIECKITCEKITILAS